jgi:hypothetical protein
MLIKAIGHKGSRFSSNTILICRQIAAEVEGAKF